MGIWNWLDEQGLATRGEVKRLRLARSAARRRAAELRRGQADLDRGQDERIRALEEEVSDLELFLGALLELLEAKGTIAADELCAIVARKGASGEEGS